MAVSLSERSLFYDLLRRPSSASADLTAASCMDAHLPMYTFPAYPVQPASKLKRTDSFPVVPDAFDQRFDSPAAGPYGLTPYTGLDSFNSLPLAISTGPHHHLEWSPSGKPLPSWAPASDEDVAMQVPDDDAQTVPQLLPEGRVSNSGRAQPRRNASDVLLAGRLGSGGADAVAGGGHESSYLPAEVPSRSLLEAALMVQWDDCADKGLFRYDVSQCETRVLPGGLGFIAQLNEGRATKKRPTEFSMDRVMQPFDAAKFNFRKASIAEALVAFHPLTQHDGVNTHAGAATAKAAASTAAGVAALEEACILPPKAPLASLMGKESALAATATTSSSSSPNLVFINVSPIDYGHVLLVPRVLDCLPQAVDPATVLLAMQFARELGSPHFRVGYNSLGAFATINHLHFHSYYQARLMPCEVAACEPLPRGLGSLQVALAAAAAAVGPVASEDGALLGLPRKRKAEEMEAAHSAVVGVRVSRLVGYPVNAFVVEAEAEAEGEQEGAEALSAAALEAVARVVGTAAERMQAANQPFNLLVSEAGRRVFVFPQCYAERQAAGVVPSELLDTGVNPAAFEIAGHLVLKRAEDFGAADQRWAERLLAQVSLDEERFMRVAEMCFGEWAGAGRV